MSARGKNVNREKSKDSSLLKKRKREGVEHSGMVPKWETEEEHQNYNTLPRPPE